MPVPTLSNVARVLESSYSYESANKFLSSFPVKSVGPRKQAIPKILVSIECISGVKFVFVEKFVKKCCRAQEEFRKPLKDADATICIRVPKVGTFTSMQLQIMTNYFATMGKLSAVSETVEWVQATSLNRLSIPPGLDEFAELDKEKAKKPIGQLVLPISCPSPFGAITSEALL
ncbi:hypothetical protein PF010_g9077 [Phytophthora fragariae]|uniref:Uncharacterized protein n=1 Tax=Phytophthora fragariae TaxID=53985 RepID=A0A6A3JGE4_9STRA|nr:hypothetical protein PF011_g16829 [Phytophthora fragariae]KAE9116122.1 hypothetical protein PF010_g9077 [Phytophthora fragariae]KAE9236733.1 hypothetical protein PF004_g8772 [Phytophthora fragariae]